MIVLCSLTTIIYLVFPFVECRPFQVLWLQTDLGWIAAGNQYTCMDEGARVVSAGAFAALQDVIVATLPLAVVWRVQMQFRKKLLVVAIFSGGYL